MKKLTAFLLAAAMVLSFAACSGGTKDNATGTESASASPSAKVSAEPSAEPSAEGSAETSAEPVELIVFAAASMTETLTEIGDMYKKVAPNVTIKYNFDSSGTLKTQIQEGADCDVFISAGQKQMNQLDINADKSVNTEGLDFINEDTRFNLVSNTIVLCVPKDNPAGVESFSDVNTDKVKMIALGNSDVPAGQYAEQAFTSLGIWDAIQSKITFGSNVKEVTTQVSEGAVDCGVVYATDAYSEGLEWVDTATSDMCTPPVYPAAVLKESKNAEAASAFLDYLKTDECSAVFEKVGFTIPEK